MDLLVYSKFMPKLSEKTYNYISDIWGRVKNEYTHYVYFPIEFESVDDGVSSVNEDWRKQVDEEFQKQLKTVREPYLIVTGSPMERRNQILEFIK